jgi:hypothetical protein
MIRRVQVGDLPQLYRVMIEAHKRYGQITNYVQSIKHLNEAIQNSIGTVVLVAVKDNEVVGYLWGEVQDTGDFFVHQLFAPKMGQQMVKAVEQVAKEAGCRRLVSMTPSLGVAQWAVSQGLQMRPSYVLEKVI